jgi:hypothetical protein
MQSWILFVMALSVLIVLPLVRHFARMRRPDLARYAKAFGKRQRDN